MRYAIGIGAAICLAVSGCNTMPRANPNRPLLKVDSAALVSRADLDYSKPVSQSESGLPIGNGRMGTLVWTIPSALKMQINRVDVFGVDRDTTSFPEKHTDYCGDCAFVDINVGGETFAGPSFHQHLSVVNGLATAEANRVSIRALATMDKDIIVLEVTDHRETPEPISVALRMLRPPVEKRFNHTATSAVGGYGDRIVLTQRFEEADFYCGSAVAAQVEGRAAHVKQAGDKEMRLVVPAEKGTFVVLVSSAGTMDRKANALAASLDTLDAAASQSFSTFLASNEKWWAAFWDKSTLHLHSADGIADQLETNFNYYLYLMASTSRGKFPTKFNGMLWITGGDLRKWGSQFWGANQSCLYNTALLATNHVELTDPMFDMYRAQLPSLEVAAREQWGSEGAFIPETGAFNGLAPLPDDIAAEMRDLYLVRKPWSERSQKFFDYATVRMGYSSRWNFIGTGQWVDGKYTINMRSNSPFGPVTHTFARGAKIAYEYWTRYQYTGDKAWLEQTAYPVIKDAAEFYRHFPNLVKESDGLYHIHHVNSNEALWDGNDTDEEISGMRGIFPTAIRASEILNTDPDLRAGWKEILEHLAPLPRSDNPLAKSTRTGAPVWIKGIPPALHGRPTATPDGNTLAEWFFDLCDLDAPAEMKATANATFDAFSRRDPDQTPEELAQAATRPAATQPRRNRGQRSIGVLSKLPLAAAKLGRSEDVKKLIPNQSFTPEVPPLQNRMDLREGPQTTSAQRLGNAADALQSALCQSLPSSPAGPWSIRLFPAWPKEWDAQFTFLERGGFLVSSSMQQGKIAFVQIRSQLGGDLPLHTPWPEPSTLYRNGKPEPMPPSQGDLLSLPTAPGDLLTLLPVGIPLNRVNVP